MAMVNFRDCLGSEIPSQPIEAGSLIVCRDTGDLYYDALNGNTRVPLSKAAHIVSGRVTSELFPQEGHLYYSTSDKMVCMYHLGQMQPINISESILTLTNIHIPTGSSTVALDDYASIIGNITVLSATPIEGKTDRSVSDLFNTDDITLTSISSNGLVANNQTGYNWIGDVYVLIVSQNSYSQV